MITLTHKNNTYQYQSYTYRLKLKSIKEIQILLTSYLTQWCVTRAGHKDTKFIKRNWAKSNQSTVNQSTVYVILITIKYKIQTGSS